MSRLAVIVRLYIGEAENVKSGKLANPDILSDDANRLQIITPCCVLAGAAKLMSPNVSKSVVNACQVWFVPGPNARAE